MASVRRFQYFASECAQIALGASIVRAHMGQSGRSLLASAPLPPTEANYAAGHHARSRHPAPHQPSPRRPLSHPLCSRVCSLALALALAPCRHAAAPASCDRPTSQPIAPAKLPHRPRLVRDHHSSLHPEASHTVRRSVIWQVRDQWGMGGRRGRRAYRFLDHLHRLRGLEHLVGDARRPPPPATVGRLAAASRDHSEPQHLRPCAANLTAPRQRHRHGVCVCLCLGPERIPAAAGENCGSERKRAASEKQPVADGAL